MSVPPRPSEPVHLFGQPPGEGETAAAAPGTGWLRLGLPLALDHASVRFLGDAAGSVRQVCRRVEAPPAAGG